jgi:hypothetical protein
MINKNVLDLKFKKYNLKRYTLVADRGNPTVITQSALLAKILNTEHNLDPIVISSYSKESRSKELYEKLGIKEFYNIFKIISLNKKIIFIIKALVAYFEIIIFFVKNKFNFHYFIKNYKYSGVKSGDFIYDTFIRYNHQYRNPNIFNYSFIKIFLLTIYQLEIIIFLLKKKKIKVIIATSKAYNSVSNLLIKCSLYLNIKVLLISGQFLKFYKKQDDNLNSIWSINYNKIFNKNKIFIKKNIKSFYYNRFFKNQRSGEFVDFNTLGKLYGKKTVKNFDFINKIFKINKKKSFYINCLALHCFSDAPTSSGQFLFRDYYHQFIETLEFLRENNPPNFYWLIKEHPQNYDYGEQNIVRDVLKKFNLPFVKLCPKNINNITLFNNIHNLFTGRSTIGLEYACFGKKPIICGVSPYSENNISINPKNPKDYFKLLITIEVNNILNNKKRFVAIKILYYLEKYLNNVIRYKSLIIPSREKKNNFYLFLKKIKSNFNSNKSKNLIEDPYFVSLKKTLLNKLKFDV